ncbi:hypothetical protein GCM10027174_10140 [Salinifilum aidingensis]
MPPPSAARSAFGRTTAEEPPGGAPVTIEGDCRVRSRIAEELEAECSLGEIARVADLGVSDVPLVNDLHEISSSMRPR